MAALRTPIAERREPLRRFPELPDAVKLLYPACELGLRPFGLRERDLDVDFEGASRPVLVTELLACCIEDGQGSAVDPKLLWQLPVGKRIEALLSLLLAGAHPELTLEFRCPNPDCQEVSEFELSLAEIAALQAEVYASERIEVAFGREAVTVRRPTGEDQLAWIGANFSDRTAALEGMARALLVGDADSTPRADWLDGIEAALDEHDPLVNFQPSVNCPSCESSTQVSIDLEDLALTGLRRAQSALLTSVHRLATHYHWSEQQVFALPHWRKVRYLRLIEDEKRR